MGRVRAGSARRHSTAEPIAGLSRPGRSGENVRPGNAVSPLESELVSPIPRRCRPPGSPPRQRAHAACGGAPGTPRIWFPAQPPAGLRIAAASPASQPSPPVPCARDAPPRSKVGLGVDAPELGAVQRGRLCHGLQRNLLLLIWAVSENSSSEQAVETGHGGLHSKDRGHSHGSAPHSEKHLPFWAAQVSSKDVKAPNPPQPTPAHPNPVSSWLIKVPFETAPPPL